MPHHHHIETGITHIIITTPIAIAIVIAIIVTR
jgi:hypothetical protein